MIYLLVLSSIFAFSILIVDCIFRLSRLFSSTRSLNRLSADALSSARTARRILLWSTSMLSTFRRTLSMFSTTFSSKFDKKSAVDSSTSTRSGWTLFLSWLRFWVLTLMDRNSLICRFQLFFTLFGHLC